MRVVSIDVGIVNLAMAVMEGEGRREDLLVVDFCLVDITWMRHGRVPRRECRLCHGRSLTDRIDHFVQEQEPVLEEADHILIEQQPPGGHQAVEQLLFSRFRDRAVLVSPVGMHSHFCMRSLGYEERKRFVEERALLRLSSNEQKERLLSMERRHDVCDAICMADYWWAKKGSLSRPSATSPYFSTSSSDVSFDEYRFTGPQKGM